MTADDYEYLARVFEAGGESVDRPSGLWRRRGDELEETFVYRQLPTPEGIVDEGFGRDNTWVRTQTIRHFQVGGPHDVPDLKPIDTATAERLIQETHGVSSMTDEFNHLKGYTA